MTDLQAQAKTLADEIGCIHVPYATKLSLASIKAVEFLRRIERGELVEKPKLRYGCVGAYRCCNCEKSGRRKTNANA